MKWIKQLLKNKKGVTSVYVILFVSALLPLLLFLCIDVPHYLDSSRKIKNVLDNASSSAITRIQDDKLPKGIIELNPEEAKEIIDKIIQHDLFLDEEFNPKKGSIVSGKPKIETHFVNNPDEITEVSTPIDNVKVNHTSVVIYAEIPVNGLFFKFNEVKMKKVAVSQARF
ncbi:cobalt ABC transporter permease [Bacillus sp. NPDC094106]|uniref:cobalt ABC transporter permease n=1 Tax=Bacillus sp. NPDC094106 TaxID=3363949 RepID=UPI00380B326E